MIGCIRTNYSYILIVLLRGPFTTCTNSGVHVLSFTVLQGMILDIPEPLHWLMLWEWTRAWQHWSKYLDRHYTCRHKQQSVCMHTLRTVHTTPADVKAKCMHTYVTADCKVLQQSQLNSGKPQLIYHTHMNLIIFQPQHTLPLCSSAIVVFHCSACLLQDFCNLLYVQLACVTLVPLWQRSLCDLLRLGIPVLITSFTIHMYRRSGNFRCFHGLPKPWK